MNFSIGAAFFFLVAGAFAANSLGAPDCGALWKVNTLSAPGTRRWAITTKVAGMDIEIAVNEGSKLVNPITLESWSEAKVTKSLIPIPDQTAKNTLTKQQFCDLLNGKKELPWDQRSPGILIAQMLTQKPLRTEKIVVPAGEFTASVYEKQMGKKGATGAIQLTAWIGKVAQRNIGLKFKARTGEGVSATETVGQLRSYKF